jgi:diacylglycerol kinase (ATP)
VKHARGELHYINLLSVGFSAHVGALTNRRFKPFGAAGYVMAVVSCLAGMRHPTYRIRVDDGPTDDRPATLLSFSNSRFTGGAMMMAPHADVGDGELDVIRVGALSRGRLLYTFPRIFRGTHVEQSDIEERRARRVVFDEPREEDVMIDGEVIKLALEELSVLPRALAVVA